MVNLLLLKCSYVFFTISFDLYTIKFSFSTSKSLIVYENKSQILFKIIATENLGLPLIISQITLPLYNGFMSTGSIEIVPYWDNFVALGTFYVNNACLKLA